MRTDTQGTIALTGFIGATCDMDPGPGTTSITATASSIIAWGFDPQGDFLWATRLAAGDYVNSPLRVEHFSDGALHLFGSCMGLELDRDPSATTDLLYTAEQTLLTQVVNDAFTFQTHHIRHLGRDALC